MLFTEILLALQRGIFRLPNLQAFHHIGRPPKGSRGRAESPLVVSAEAKPFVKQGKARKVFPQPSTRNLFSVKNPIRSKRRAPKVSKGRSESPLVASAEAKPFVKQGKARKVFPLPSTRNLVFMKNPIRPKRRAPKVSKGRAESPLVASAEAKPSVLQEKQGRAFPCHPQEICFLWEVSSACGRTRYFPSLESTQRVPGAAKGCMSHGRPRTPRC